MAGVLFLKNYSLSPPLWPHWVSGAVRGLSVAVASRGHSPAVTRGCLVLVLSCGAVQASGGGVGSAVVAPRPWSERAQ